MRPAASNYAAWRGDWGPAEAERIEADLLGLVPDLLRLYDDGRPTVLSRVEERLGERPFVMVQDRRMFVMAGMSGTCDLAPCFWHVDEVHLQREMWGGSAERMPMFTPQGVALRRGELGTFGDGPAWHERYLRSRNAADLAGALATMGIGFEVDLVNQPIFVPALWREAARLWRRYGIDQELRLLPNGRALVWHRDGPRLRMPNWQAAYRGFTRAGQAPSDELDLLWRGAIEMSDLHPLTRQALFPAAIGPMTQRLPVFDPVRVRCGGQWHLVEITPHGLRVPHSDKALLRESAVAAHGGQVSGCFRAYAAWRMGRGRLPRRLRMMRDDFFDTVAFGHIEQVEEMVAAGFPVTARGPGAITVLHCPALLAVTGTQRWLEIDVNATDAEGNTPLHVAVRQGFAEVVAELLAAGADKRRKDGQGCTPLMLTRQYPADQNPANPAVIRLLQ